MLFFILLYFHIKLTINYTASDWSKIFVSQNNVSESAKPGFTYNSRPACICRIRISSQGR
jgi:hypothetical protein